jgi:hypothetical protein
MLVSVQVALLGHTQEMVIMFVLHALLDATALAKLINVQVSAQSAHSLFLAMLLAVTVLLVHMALRLVSLAMFVLALLFALLANMLCQVHHHQTFHYQQFVLPALLEPPLSAGSSSSSACKAV